jgi:uroporphyrinogen-III decarboxylase
LGSETTTPAFLYVADIAGNQGPLFAPAWLEANYYPRLKRIVDAFKQRGIRFIYHCDGDVMPMLDRLLEVGIDGLHPLDPMGGMSLKRVRKKVGQDLVLFGNANINIPGWTEHEAELEARRCIEEGAARGPYFLSTAVGLSEKDHVPPGNIVAFYRAVETYGRYAEAE